MSAVRFTPFEQTIFNLLESQLGKICSKRAIEEHLYVDRPLSEFPESNGLEVFIRRIRRKLPKGLSIRTFHRQGYMLEKIPMCDVCSNEQGTTKFTGAAGTETLACGKCLLNLNSQELQQ